MFLARKIQHEDEPAELNFPASQSVHVDAPSVALTSSLYFPALTLHVAAPVLLYLPASHAGQCPAPSLLCFPGVHMPSA